ncbi:MAG: CDC27 family protein, partial [Rhodocyclales bacterium]|nr:CDC27 family protein [Rhodocyclales bacterium]
MRLTQQVLDTKKKLVEGIRTIDGLFAWDNDLFPVCFGSSNNDLESIVGGMTALGWILLGNYEPPLVNLPVDPATDGLVTSTNRLFVMSIYLRTIIISLALIGLTTGPLTQVSGSALAAEEASSSKDKVRPEVGKPLQAAQELTKAKQYKEALDKVDAAAAVPDQTPFEAYLIARTRGAAAFSDGQIALAAQSFSAAMAFDRMTPMELFEITRALAVQFYNKPDYPNAIVWASRYLDKGGTDPQLKALLAQSYFLQNDFGKAAALLQELNRADEAAGRVTAESQLQLWANCELKLNRNAGMIATLEKLASHYPKKDYWNDLIRQSQRNPAFSERLSLDAYRLQRYAGSLDGTDEVLEMAGLALQAGYPVEAKQLIDQGYADKLLGSAPHEARHKKLQDQANK